MTDSLFDSLYNLLSNSEYKENIELFKQDIHNINNLLKSGKCFLSPYKLNEQLNQNNENLINQIETKILLSKKKNYSFSLKQKVYEEFNSHTVKELSNKYEIPYSTILKWKIYGIEKRIKKKFEKKNCLSEETIEKVLELYHKYPPGTLTRTFFRKEVLKISNLENFQASNGWLAGFEKKYDLKFLNMKYDKKKRIDN